MCIALIDLPWTSATLVKARSKRRDDALLRDAVVVRFEDSYTALISAKIELRLGRPSNVIPSGIKLVDVQSLERRVQTSRSVINDGLGDIIGGHILSTGREGRSNSEGSKAEDSRLHNDEGGGLGRGTSIKRVCGWKLGRGTEPFRER
jgi:hypothetical protein